MTKATVEAREVVIGGKLEHFRLKKNDGKGVQAGRKYFVTTVPFSEARDIFSPNYYNVKTGKGEQRESTASQVNKIKNAMLQEDFTPCAVHVSMKKHHQESIKIDEQGNASIVVSTNDPLPLPNGNHRFTALNNLRTFYTDSHDDEALKLLDQIPITAVVLADGNTQKDFLNLQKGKTVDGSHMLCLLAQTKSLAEKYQPLVKTALDIAKRLNTDLNSPFAKQIRFDTGSMAPLPVSSLCAKGASDLATSLVGTAKLIAEYEIVDAETGKENKDWAPNLIIGLYNLIKERSPEVLGNSANRNVLTPPPEGTKGSATMMIGVANCVGYYLQAQAPPRDEMTEEDKALVIEAVNSVLNRSCRGSFSSPMKRQLIGQFAKALFVNVACEKHEGVPLQLIKLFSTSTFGICKIVKPKKQSRVTLAQATIVEDPTEEQALANAEQAVADLDEFELPPEEESQKSNDISTEQVLVEA